METTLLVITVISVAVAIYAWASVRRLQRRERERSEARVAALSAAADAPVAAESGWTQVAGEWQWTPEPQVNTEGIGHRGLGISSGPVSRVTPVTHPTTNPQSRIPDPEALAPSSEAFFGTVQREDGGHRLPLFAAAALIAMLGGALIFLNTSASTQDAATIAQVAHNEPLELVALAHARDAKVLTITGTVRNPSSGPRLEGLTAVVTLLDKTGALVSTKDVPLDYRALRPGEEAPFKVSVPDPGVIARYRVSFRAGTDVVPHVDRRGDTKLASALR